MCIYVLYIFTIYDVILSLLHPLAFYMYFVVATLTTRTQTLIINILKSHNIDLCVTIFGVIMGTIYNSTVLVVPLVDF